MEVGKPNQILFQSGKRFLQNLHANNGYFSLKEDQKIQFNTCVLYIDHKAHDV